MSVVPHHRMSLLAARLMGVVLLLQLLAPLGARPVGADLVGADGTVLPTAFCKLPAGHGGDAPDEHDRHAVDHCVLCRIPAGGSLGLGAVPGPLLPVPRTGVLADRTGPVDRSLPGRPVLVFAARAPPGSAVT